MATEISTEALVLRRFDTGEADRVVWLLTPGRGKISAFAAGARRSKRRFAGALEPFTRLSVQLQPPGRGDLWRLCDAQALDVHGSIRGSLEAMASASAACELAWALAVEGGQSHGAVGPYELLLTYLRRLDREPAAPASKDDLYRFLLMTLGLAGVRPHFTACARCGRPEATRVQHFDPAEGGRLCEGCRPRSPTGHAIDPRLLEALGAFEAGGDCPAGGRVLLWGYAQHHVGRPLKSLGLLTELGL